MTKAQSRLSTKLHPLEFRVWRKLQALGLPQESRVVVACSGGLDSIALVECLSRVAPRLGWQVDVASVHHGRSRKLSVARDKAFKAAERVARERGLVFHGRKRDQRLKELASEAELRDFRHPALRDVVLRCQAFALVFAHHADDLFETRLIRLIRGTGPEGLKAMSLWSNGILRPLLDERRASLERYARERGLQWCEDPSNRDLQPLRNWLRHDWLPALEQKRSGAGWAFARSLESLVESLESREKAEVPSVEGGYTFDRRQYQRLERGEQRHLLSAILRRAGRRNFSSRQLDEIRKRLEGRAREFTLFDLQWKINAGQITVASAGSAGIATNALSI